MACSNPNFGGLERERSGLGLMQNCDLPPPVKVFAGPDKVVLSPMTRVYNTVVEGGENDGLGCSENEKLELLKALRLSQTRAREAEKKAASLTKERDCLRRVLLEDSLWLFGYRQLVKLLELQLSRVQGQGQKGQFYSGCCRSNEEEDGKDAAGMTWFVAWTLCLGIAGVGFAIGCRYIF
ncbi:uncharacterized protein LOC130781542 [Actinidia eriantha]|uniref:uncharacterized protein LOC130781542 n=1 Tax=Actinidia eriantha TaxID=165200 RepID=UPI002583D106|nr:uncharacterized protein LOC130781542 [Actinidia eriantha]